MKVSVVNITAILLLSTGCNSLSNLAPASYQIEQLNKNQFQNLNGIYRNYQDTAFGQIITTPKQGEKLKNYGLLDRLFIFIPNEAYSDSTLVEIEFVTDKKAIVKSYNNGMLIFSRKLKGELKNGYFYVNPKLLIIPFFPLVYYHTFEQVRIGKVGQNIIIDNSVKMCAFSLLFWGIGFDKGTMTTIYTKN